MGGWWWRFSDYVIDDLPVSGGDGFYSPGYIRPAPGAKLEAYQLKSTGENFQSLLGLDIEDEAAIIRWCRQYGLLGILPQETLQLQLAPRWRRIGFSDSGGHRAVLSPYQIGYLRTQDGWRSMDEGTGWGYLELKGNEQYRGQLAEPRTGATTITPTALVAPIFSATYEQKGLGEAIGHFFPHIPPEEKDTALYPHPLDDDFWEQYCEPLEEFQWVVTEFKTMMKNLSYAGPWETSPVGERGAMIIGRDQLNSLLSFYPSLEIQEDGRIIDRWTFPSLLAIFAFEVWQKLIGGQSVKQCKRTKCRRLFLSAQYNREYCSERCRQTEEKARQRQRQDP